MHDALIFLTDVLLLALVLIGLALIHSQQRNRQKADEAAKLLQEHMNSMDRHKECLFAHSRLLTAWVAMQKVIADAAKAAQDAKD